MDPSLVIGCPGEIMATDGDLAEVMIRLFVMCSAVLGVIRVLSRLQSRPHVVLRVAIAGCIGGVVAGVPAVLGMAARVDIAGADAALAASVLLLPVLGLCYVLDVAPSTLPRSRAIVRWWRRRFRS